MLATERCTPPAATPFLGESSAELVGATLRFPLGLPGFPGAERFRLEPIPASGGAFQLLRCMDLEDVRLVVTPLVNLPVTVQAAHIEEARFDLGIDPKSLLVMGVVTLARAESSVRAFVNLRAPLFIDVDHLLGVQYYLIHGSYALRQPLPAA